MSQEKQNRPSELTEGAKEKQEFAGIVNKLSELINSAKFKEEYFKSHLDADIKVKGADYSFFKTKVDQLSKNLNGLKTDEAIKRLLNLIAIYVPKEIFSQLGDSFKGVSFELMQKIRLSANQELKDKLETAEYERYKKDMISFINGIDRMSRYGFMKESTKEYLIKLSQKYKLNIRDSQKEGFPLMIIIKGEKWYISDPSTKPREDDIKMFGSIINNYDKKIDQARKNGDNAKIKVLEIQKKAVLANIEKINKDIPNFFYLIKADNILIQATFEKSEFEKNPKKILDINASIAMQEWKEQEKQKETLREFDLPKSEQIYILDLYPGYMDKNKPGYKPDNVNEKAREVLTKTGLLLKNKGYKVTQSPPVYTYKPEETIKQTLEWMKRQKPPIKHIIIQISTHGMDKESGGGSQFIDADATKPKLEKYLSDNLPDRKKISQLIGAFLKGNLEMDPKFSKYKNIKDLNILLLKVFPKLSQTQIKEINTAMKKFNSDFEKNLIDADKTQRLHGDELVSICKDYPDIKFNIYSVSCHGGDFARYFKDARLSNVMLFLGAQPYNVVQSTLSQDPNDPSKERQKGPHVQVFFQKALIHMGSSLDVPMVVNSKLVNDEKGKPKMTRMQIKTVGDAMYYADIMSTFMGTTDDPEVILPPKS